MGRIDEERDEDDMDRPSGDEDSPQKTRGNDGEEDPEESDNRQPDSKLLQVEVSILDLDRQCSVNLDRDSEEDEEGKGA